MLKARLAIFFVAWPSIALTAGRQELLNAHGARLLGDCQEAIKLYRSYAKRDHVEAQYWLGSILLDPSKLFHCPKSVNAIEGIVWLDQAAQDGYAPAQYLLGKAYFQGKGVIYNRERGIFWLTKAAQHGFEPAMTDLGYLYRDHLLDIPDHNIEAGKWFYLADQVGHNVIAWAALKRLEKELTDEQINEIEQRGNQFVTEELRPIAQDFKESELAWNVDYLIRSLNHPSPEVRAKAAQLLGDQRERAKKAIPALIQALDDRQVNVVVLAAQALTAIDPQNEQVVSAFVSRLNSSSEALRSAVAQGLSFGGLKARHAISELIGLLNSDSASNQGAALGALTRLEPLLGQLTESYVLSEDEKKKERLALEGLVESGVLKNDKETQRKLDQLKAEEEKHGQFKKWALANWWVVRRALRKHYARLQLPLPDYLVIPIAHYLESHLQQIENLSESD